MRRLVVGALLSVVGAAVLAAPAMGEGNSLGPPGGTFYAFDEAYESVVTPTAIPDKGKFDTLYVFPDCPDCAPVSDAAPGHPGYNGGRWKVVEASGITEQLTNADAVEAAATSLSDTGTRFVCPLIKG